MNNKGITPFIRNNYFKGKQLTVRDFQDEQNYCISKLAALHSTNLGSGVAAGLDVVAVDSRTVSVEAGCACDSFGRDILVSEPVLKDIRTVDGFSDLDGSRSAYLCIEYKETPLEAVNTVTDSVNRTYNRIGEGYRLFLTNTRPKSLPNDLLSVITETKELICAPNVSVQVSVPKFVNCDDKLIITVVTEKINLDKSLSVEFDADHPSFFNGEGNTSAYSYFNATERFDRSITEIEVTPSKKMVGLNKLRITPDRVKLSVDNSSVSEGVNTLEFDVEIITESVRERVRREYFRREADFSFSRSRDYLYLAEICMITENNDVFIDRIYPLPFRQYVMSERLSYLLDNLPMQPKPSFDERTAVSVEQPPVQEQKTLVSCGIENIDIDVDHRGRIYYSAEIIHGLGEGDISYSIGFEPINSDSGAVLYGSPELFEGSMYNMEFPKVQYSIISYNDKGTFRIAVKLLDRVNAGMIRIHWQAVRASEPSEKSLMEIDRMTISIKPNLVNIAPRETVTLECIIEGCDNQNCIWSVEDKNGGTIAKNGVYKAPSTEGVYTVTATSVKYPTKKAVNYIIVGKKREL
ncbi:MAG: Ig domain-containing protein [Ruminiclostridium sp.]